MKRKILNRYKTILLGILLCILCVGCGEPVDDTEIRVGALKGPTSMGMLFMMDEEEKFDTVNHYSFQMATTADELLPLMVQEKLDIALVPANVAGILYQKTEGGICVVDINTLGVLYMVSGDTTIQSIEDLKDTTIYLTGKGTTPDYALQYLLAQNGMTAEDCTLEYRSEPTEVAAILAENPNAIGLLPQPFVTAACKQNQSLSVVLSMNEEWSKVAKDDQGGMVTGVTVVRKAFLQEHETAVKTFLQDHTKSTQAINENPEKGAKLCVAQGIVAKEPIAQAAIPQCNITCVTGEEMADRLSGYLQVLYEMAPESVGGTLPGEDFYYQQ